MNTEQERADFEAWYMREFGVYPRRNESGSFKSQYVAAMFKAWKAGRAALQSQDREDAERYRWLRDPCSGAEHVIFYCRGDYGRGLMSGGMLDEAIDHARRIEGDGK